MTRQKIELSLSFTSIVNSRIKIASKERLGVKKSTRSYRRNYIRVSKREATYGDVILDTALEKAACGNVINFLSQQLSVTKSQKSVQDASLHKSPFMRDRVSSEKITQNSFIASIAFYHSADSFCEKYVIQ